MDTLEPDNLIKIITNKEGKTVKKGTLLLLQGNTSKYAYYVIKGCLKSAVTDAAGKEHIVQFAPEGWFISDMQSFRDGVPSQITIEAIEDSEVVFLGKDSVGKLENLPDEILLKHINTLQNSIIALNKRLITLLSSSAEERYLEFINTYPSLTKRLQLKFIASYIGITPEFLSRIRKNMTDDLFKSK